MDVVKSHIDDSNISEKDKKLILKMLNNTRIHENKGDLVDIFDKLIEKEC